jgi:hypothetical protein
MEVIRPRLVSVLEPAPATGGLVSERSSDTFEDVETSNLRHPSDSPHRSLTSDNSLVSVSRKETKYETLSSDTSPRAASKNERKESSGGPTVARLDNVSPPPHSVAGPAALAPPLPAASPHPREMALARSDYPTLIPATSRDEADATVSRFIAEKRRTAIEPRIRPLMNERAPLPGESRPQTTRNTELSPEHAGEQRRQLPAITPLSMRPPPESRPVATAEASDSAPVIRVTIGRIDVRAVSPPQAPAPKAKPSPPALSLEDYLRSRHSGKR